MKTKLFLLVSCLITAVSLNAQTLDVQAVEKSEYVTESSASQSSQSLTVYVWYDSNNQQVIANLSSAISCDIRLKGSLYWGGRPQYREGSAIFSIRISAGNTSGYSGLNETDPNGTSTPEGYWKVELNEEPLQGCDGYTLIYSLERNGYYW